MKIGSALALAFLYLPLAPSAAMAVDDQEGRKACMMDALTVCAEFIPDRDRIAACLMTNRDRISAPCRTLIVVRNTSAQTH
jgi:hypothetical protein